MYILFSVYYYLQQRNYLNKKIISVAFFGILNGHIIFYFLTKYNSEY